jgi:hypothetical protein
MNTGDKCPQCGYVEKGPSLLQHNRMSEYVDAKATPSDNMSGIYNNDAKSIVVKGKTLIRKDVFDVQASTVTPTPAVKK